MTEVDLWSKETRAQRACAALVKNGFDAVYVKTAAEAAELVMKFVKPGMKLGFGGSMTIKALEYRIKPLR